VCCKYIHSMRKVCTFNRFLRVCLNFTKLKTFVCWCYLPNAEESSVPDLAAPHAMRQFGVDSRSRKIPAQRRLCVRVTCSLRLTHVYPHVPVTPVYNRHVNNWLYWRVVFSYPLHLPDVSQLASLMVWYPCYIKQLNLSNLLLINFSFDSASSTEHKHVTKQQKQKQHSYLPSPFLGDVTGNRHI